MESKKLQNSKAKTTNKQRTRKRDAKNENSYLVFQTKHDNKQKQQSNILKQKASKTKIKSKNQKQEWEANIAPTWNQQNTNFAKKTMIFKRNTKNPPPPKKKKKQKQKTKTNT